jgi:hypothetical protein
MRRLLSRLVTWLMVLVWAVASLVVAMLAAKALGIDENATLTFLGSATGDAVFVAVMVALIVGALLVWVICAVVWDHLFPGPRTRHARRSGRHDGL